MSFEAWKPQILYDQDGGGGPAPRHPTQLEIAQAILKHIEETTGSSPSALTGAYEQLFDPGGAAKSHILYWGTDMGVGEFDFQWPTTPIDPEDNTALSE